jgi:hypothetical protein
MQPEGFMIVFTRAFHWSLTWARWIHSIPPYSTSFKSHFLSYSHLCLDLPTGLFPSVFVPNSYLHSWFFHACYIPCLSHIPWYRLSNYICEAPQYAILSDLWLFNPNSVQLFSSAPVPKFRGDMKTKLSEQYCVTQTHKSLYGSRISMDIGATWGRRSHFPQLRNLQPEVGILALSVADHYALLFCYMAAAQIERWVPQSVKLEDTTRRTNLARLQITADFSATQK